MNYRKIASSIGLNNSVIAYFLYKQFVLIRYRHKWNSIIEFRNFKISIGKDVGLFPSVYNGDFERLELDAILSLDIKPGNVVWDVGANIGLYSIFLKKISKVFQ